jgi:hypothetical protein
MGCQLLDVNGLGATLNADDVEQRRDRFVSGLAAGCR